MARTRRTRDDLRQQLLEAALVEFGAKGFAGASTRSIAQRVDAHQPQINYHFASKDALWEAAVDHLFGRLTAEVGDLPLLDVTDDDPVELGTALADGIRRFVRFAAAHPELNQIMVHEATDDSERLRWMVEHHVRPIYDAIRSVWQRLRAAGSAASLPYVNAPEARLLTGVEPTDRAWVDTHADGLVATLLPGLVGHRPPVTREGRGRRTRSRQDPA